MIVLKKKNIVIVSVLIVVALTFILCFGALSNPKASSIDSTKIKVVLDAGHGGIDEGAIGTTYNSKESKINLSIVYFLKDYLEDAGFFVVLTRSSDAGLYGVASSSLKKKDMQKRKEIILESNPNLVVSIHLNKYTVSSRRGAQVFYKKGDENGKSLASNIQNSFNNMEEAVRTLSPLSGDYYILNCSDFPSVICECGFLSNPQEERLLATEEYQKNIAYAIFKGIVSYMAQATIKYF